MLIFRLGFRNSLRNIRRSMLTASMVVMGVAALVVAMSWIEGILGGMITSSTDTIGHVRVADPDFVKREQLMPMYENIADVAPVVEAAAAIPGVTAAYPVIQTGAAVSAGDEFGDTFGLVVGAPEPYFSETLKLEKYLVEGTWFTGDPNEFILGERLAKKADAEVGKDVLLIGQTQDGAMSPIKGKVVGIIHSGTAAFDQRAFVPLAKAQYLVDIPDGAIEVLAFGADRHAAAGIRDAMKADPAFTDYEVQAWSDREPWNALAGIIIAMQGILGGFVVFIVGLGIWVTMMASVLERTGEIGVLRAMGLSRVQTVLMFVFEAMLIAAVGGVFGVLLGAGPAYWLEVNGITFGEDLTQNIGTDMVVRPVVYGDMSPSVAIKGFLLGLAMAIVGSAIPAIRAALIQPVEAMRARR